MTWLPDTGGRPVDDDPSMSNLTAFLLGIMLGAFLAFTLTALIVTISIVQQ